MTKQLEVPPKVMTFTEVAQSAGISLSTLRREIDRGTGPEVVALSLRRKGVRSDHYRHWLDARVANAQAVQEERKHLTKRIMI